MFSNYQLSKKTNMSHETIRACNRDTSDESYKIYPNVTTIDQFTNMPVSD
jgi:hypothetical protein